jgi:hypothetical protein
MQGFPQFGPVGRAICLTSRCGANRPATGTVQNSDFANALPAYRAGYRTVSGAPAGHQQWSEVHPWRQGGRR